MGRSLLLLCLCFALSQDAQADRNIWRVQSGEVLSRLALRFGVSVDELREWNGLDSDRLLVGQELRLVAPAGAAASSAASEPEASSVGSAAPDDVAPAAGDVDGSEASASPADEGTAIEEQAERTGSRTESAEGASSGRASAAERAERVAPQRPFEGVVHTVRRGETLSGIAQRHGVSLAELTALNPSLNVNRVMVGARVNIREEQGRRTDYRVRRGDTLSHIASRYRVSISDLRRWNRRLGSSLIAGTELRIWSEVPESVSESIGSPNHGSLVRPERLPPHPGYIIRDRHRAFGTLETVMWIQDGFDAVRVAFPDSPQVRVHDISDHNGGPMYGHRSHQSGRDVDISYFQKQCDGPCAFRRVHPSTLDAPRQLALLRHWLENDQVDAIFIDYGLQEVLYEEARRQGATRAQLSRWFQYPRGRTYSLGLVRHFPKHRDHLHVRFVCPDTDESCRH